MNSKEINKYKFKNYNLLRKLGEGAFSTVFLAQQSSTGQSVAVKILKSEGIDDQDTAESRAIRFKREMKLCSSLYHSNIVKVLDFGKTLEGALFTVFEYVPGKSLAQIISQEGALHIGKTFDIMGQVLDALALSHSKGVIHRDLKPDNIMVSDDGKNSVKLLDFGIGKFVNEKRDSIKVTHTREFLGTPAYASPEQIRGEEVTHKADIFAWGLIFLECLTGTNAFNESNKAKLIQKQLSKDNVPIPLSLNNTSLGSFLSWVLQKNPERRAADSLEVFKRYKLLTIDSIPQTGGFLKATQKTIHELIHFDKDEYASLNRRRISVVNCFLKFSGNINSDNSLIIDCLYHDTIELCRSHVENNGGFVAGSGAALVSYFGYPEYGGFHVRAAAKTALDISSSLSQTKKTLEVRHGVYLNWKVSVHTGDVTIRKSSDNNQVFGVVLGDALSLCKSSEDNLITVSSDIYKNLKKSFNFHEQADGTFKLTGLREVQSLFSRYKNESLYGRGAELHKLETIRQRSLIEGQAVMIVGEAGIGKSRFMAESVTTTAIERSSIYELLCYPENKNSALSPFLDFLKKFFKIEEFESIEACEKSLLTELSGCEFDSNKYISLMFYWLGIESVNFPPLCISPQKQKDIFLEFTVKLFFEHILEEKSTLIFDDLHWIDPTSLDLLTMMLDKIDNYSCIILMSARPEFISPWNQKLISLIELQRLKEKDVHQMVQNKLLDTDLPKALIDSIIERVDGNPLFAEEVIHSLMSDKGRKIFERRVPETLKEFFTSKLESIGEGRLAAQLAAVIGRKFSYDLLNSIYPDKEGVLLADLTQLLAAGIIHVIPRSDELEYVFHHALVCDSAYESMTPDVCRNTHSKIAAVVHEKISKDEYQENNPLARELAHHYLKAGELDSAARYQFISGKQLFRVSAYKEAMVYFETALGCLENQKTKDQEVAIRIKFALCLKTVFGWSDSRAVSEYEKIIRLAENGANLDIEELSPIIFGRWVSEMMTLDFSKALTLANQYLSLAENTANEEVLMQAQLTMANNLYWLGEIQTANSHALKSISFHEALNSQDIIEKVGYDPVAMSHMFHVLCTWSLGKLQEAENLIQNYLNYADKLNHPFSRAIILQGAAWHYYHTQEPGKCLVQVEHLLRISQKFSMAFYEGMGWLFKGWCIGKEGDPVKGVMTIKKANTEFINPSNGIFLNSLYSCILADVLLCGDNADEAVEVLKNSISIAEINNENCYLPELYRLMAEAFIFKQDLGRAECYLYSAIKTAEKYGMLMYNLRAHLDHISIKMMNGNDPDYNSLKCLLDQFDEGEHSIELEEAYGLISI